MYWKIVRNDMANSKLITGMTTLFVAVAALLVTLSAVLIVHLTSAIDTLMKQAETSHFLQSKNMYYNSLSIEGSLCVSPY